MLKRKAIAITTTLLLASVALFLAFGSHTPPDRAEPAPLCETKAAAPPETKKETETPETPIPEAADPERELLSLSGLTAAELETGLLGDLKPFAENFIAAERETGVNAVFLAAVAALESGWNTSNVADTKNNLFGWSAATGYMDFDSKQSCIAEVATCVKRLYLSPDGEYFNGYTVEAVNVRYNGNKQWENAVKQIMQEIKARTERSGENVE